MNNAMFCSTCLINAESLHVNFLLAVSFQTCCVDIQMQIMKMICANLAGVWQHVTTQSKPESEPNFYFIF